MATVTVLILHPEPGPAAGPLTRALAAARLELAGRHRRGFLAAGADDVRVIAGVPDDTAFGARLRSLVRRGSAGRRSAGGLIVLGSGSIPLATTVDRRALVATAASGEARALTNGRYSADVVALGRTELLDGLPDLRADNALPRWLAGRGGVRIDELSGRQRLSIDLDSPLDLVLLARRRSSPGWQRAIVADLPADRVDERLEGLVRVSRDPTAELLVAGRTSAATLRWLERRTASRTRSLVEERGLRASEALGPAPARPQRQPASLLGAHLDAVGPSAMGRLVATIADGALIDLRVLLAHRLGADERRWPPPEDRFAADLLLADRIVDGWLAELVRSAAEAPIPIVLGGHTLVGPGLRLVLAPGGGTGSS